MKRGLFCLLIGVSLFVGPEAFCFNISVDTAKVELPVVAGEVIHGQLIVRNPSEDNIQVKIYLEDFVYIAPYDGTKKFLPPGTTESSAAKWINFSPQEVLLPPFARRKVNYVINVPEGVSGGYYAVLFFETSLGAISDQQQGANILVLGRVGTLFLLEAEGSLKQAELGNIEVTGNSLSGEFINQGDVVIAGKGNFYVMDDIGSIFDRGSITSVYIAPGDQAPFSLSLAKDIPNGEYTLVLTFDLEDGDVLVREVDFSKATGGRIKILQIRD